MEKRCTIKTIAEKLGVAPSTVTRAFQPNSRISDARRALILKTAKELNYIPNQAASRLNRREVYIGILIQNVYPEGQQQILRGIEEAYRTFSDYKVSYRIDFFDESQNSPQYCADLFAKYAEYDGLILSGLDSPYLLTEIKKFHANGKAVVLLQSGPDYDGYLLRSVPNAGLAARMAAEFLSVCTASLPHRRIVLFTGRQTLEVHREGKRSFLAACRDENMEVTEVYDMQDSENTLSALLPTVLTPERLAETEGIYITSGLSIPLCRYLEDMGVADRIFLVTTDSSPRLQGYIHQKTVNASIYQNFFRQAWNAYEVLVKHLIAHTESEKVTSPHPELILSANSDYYMCP